MRNTLSSALSILPKVSLARPARAIANTTLAISLLVGLLSCSTPPSPQVIEATVRGDIEGAARVAIESELKRQGVPVDEATASILIDAFLVLLREAWGEEEPEVASKRRYVKYSGKYAARAIVDFEQGFLQVETVATVDPESALREAIIGALLTDRDMTVEDIFSTDEPPVGGEPFLFEQILDTDGQPIRWRWRAERFARHLIATKIDTRRENERVIRSVRVPLVVEHLKLRQLEYADAVLAAASQYRVSPTLIYAVIEVESAFNPYAVSSANAYGLMQVVPATAGRDVYERVKGQTGQPTRQQLFQPAFNIDIGSAYLHLLDDTYLEKIEDANSRKFAMIAAYNGGAGSTLRAFDTSRERALSRINLMSSEQVYAHIVSRHPFTETRRYLEKVRRAERGYR
jgi:membrane-bound lytic murein transglycosylase C